MKMKMAWVSYPLWLLYAIITGGLLTVYVSAFGVPFWNANPYITATVTAVVFGLVAGIWCVGNKVAVYLNKRFTDKKRLMDVWECVIVAGLILSAFIYRLCMILHMDAMELSSGLYDRAMIKAGEDLTAMTHRASCVYTLVLSGVLSFTGNKEMVGVFVQLFLEVAAILVLYAAIRWLAGRAESIVVISVMAFSTQLSRELFSLTPEVFYLMLYAVGVLLLGLCVRRNTMCRLALAGFYIGWLGYMDLSGLVLWLAGIGLCINYPIHQGGSSGRQKLEPFVFGMLSPGMMFVCWAIDAVGTNRSLKLTIAEWFGTYANIQGIGFPAGPDQEPAVGIVIVMLAALAVLGYRYQKKAKQNAWMGVLIVFTLLDMLGIGVLRYEVFLTVIWGVLAGIGISSMSIKAESIPAENIRVENIEQDKAVRVKPPLKELVVEEITLEQEPPKVQLIENPLPLPKKHVKKEMDYDYFVDEEDDFDIKL